MKFFILYFLFSVGCTRGALKSSDQLMRPTASPNKILDDLNYNEFNKALLENINRHLQLDPNEVLSFGPKKIKRSDYVEALQRLGQYIIESGEDKIDNYISENFEFYEVYGREDWGEVFITSYYEPMIEGSLKKTARLTQPLYSMPHDMVIVNLESFVKTLPQLTPIKDVVLEQKSRSAVIRGRLFEENSVKKVRPYYDRKEIDQDQKLENQKGIILAYVDPIDAFFLQIQGSGSIRLPKGKIMRVGYEAQNGHPYVPIGKYMTDVIPLEKMSLQRIEEYLRSLSREEIQSYLNKNPSYVFFQKLETRGVTYFGTEVVDGRTIATDYTHFPKGTLAYLKFEKPIFESPQDEEPSVWLPESRFVFDQDTGGAIRGPGRVDLFWGQGLEARQVAGVMKRPGRLLYLVPRQSN